MGARPDTAPRLTTEYACIISSVFSVYSSERCMHNKVEPAPTAEPVSRPKIRRHPMDLSWINSLPEPTKSIVISALAKVASDIVGRLINASGYAIKKAFTSEPQQQALTDATAQALIITARSLTDDPILFEHYVGLLGNWAQREAVAGELSQVIDPRPETTLDVDLLTAEFEALGYEPELVDEELDFPQIVARFASAFYEAAAAEPELQETIKIGLLRGIAERADQQAREGRKQTQTLTEIGDAVRRLGPELDLDDLERAYLRGLYADCNDLPLAGRPPDEGGRQPRMQRVYVDLMTELATHGRA